MTYDPNTNATIGEQMPDHSEILTDAKIWDLVKFIKEGFLDVTQLYDATYTELIQREKRLTLILARMEMLKMVLPFTELNVRLVTVLMESKY